MIPQKAIETKFKEFARIAAPILHKIQNLKRKSLSLRFGFLLKIIQNLLEAKTNQERISNGFALLSIR